VRAKGLVFGCLAAGMIASSFPCSEAATQRPDFVLEGGITRFKYNQEDVYEAQSSYYFGGTVRIHLYATMSLRVGVFYSHRVTEIPTDPEQITVGYLEIPMLFEVASKGRVSARALGGIAPSALTSAHSSEVPELDLARLLESQDVGLVLGFGADVGRIGIETRYAWGLWDVVGQLKNRTWTAGITLRL
jgi:hypothetical protein